MPTDTPSYPYIRAWGDYLGSYQYFINAEVERAQRDGAPRNAIYKDGSEWRTFDDVSSPHTRLMIEAEFDRRGWAR